MQVLRVVAVILLVSAAVALLSDGRRLPAAIRGIARAMGAHGSDAIHHVSPFRRVMAFVLILAALALAIL